MLSFVLSELPKYVVYCLILISEIFSVIGASNFCFVLSLFSSYTIPIMDESESVNDSVMSDSLRPHGL